MILDTLEVHSNCWIYLHTELFFKLLYWSESYANFKHGQFLSLFSWIFIVPTLDRKYEKSLCYEITRLHCFKQTEGKRNKQMHVKYNLLLPITK